MGIRIDGTSDLINATDGSLTIEGQSVNTTGVVTATSGFKVGTAATLSANGNATFSGIVTASSYVGDGSALTGIAGTEITNSDFAVGITTFFADYSTGKVGIGTLPARTLQVFAATPQLNLKSASGGNCELQFGDTADEVRANIIYNSTDNYLGFNGYNNTERLRIDSSGNMGLGGAPIAPGHLTCCWCW